jgi:peptidoglycan/xylan/chitin deacetylase (PgdA/CDA1 family)
MLFPALTAAGIVAAAAGVGANAATRPTSQLFGATIIAGSDRADLALTFDDGPNDPETPLLLDLLVRHSVRATFFVIGSYVRQRPQTLRDIAAAGHLIGNHTQTHPNLFCCSTARIRQELAQCNADIQDAIGAPVHFMRCPFGFRRPAVLRIARSLGLTPVMWNVSAYDWREEITAAQILANVNRGIARNQRRGSSSNILLHDGSHRTFATNRRATVDAVRLLLEQHAATARFVTPEEWA